MPSVGSWPGVEPKLCVAAGAFNCDELRVLLSDLSKNQEPTSLGIKASCCVYGMSVVIIGCRAEQENRFGQMMNFHDFHVWRPLNQGKWTVQNQFCCAGAQCRF